MAHYTSCKLKAPCKCSWVAYMKILYLFKSYLFTGELVEAISMHCTSHKDTTFLRMWYFGYGFYRNDRKKGGGGVLVYISSDLICNRIKLERYNPITYQAYSFGYSTDITSRNMIVIGMYWPPRSITTLYRRELEEELNHICNWANLQRQSIVILEDRTSIVWNQWLMKGNYLWT